VNVYAESSAVLAWLLAEPGGEMVREALATAQLVTASELTLIECSRVLIRSTQTGMLAEARAAEREALLHRSEAHWAILAIEAAVIERARRPFPLEPVRTLDAIHLASALVARRAIPDLVLLSLDDRVRSCGLRLGFDLLPA
jgi:predicted nucleic acid-binding protein